jgi:mono/diheme cytochrome c family protein
MVMKVSFASWFRVCLLLSVGCGSSEAPDNAGPLSEAKARADGSWCQAQKVFVENCVACHTEGGVGPMPLETYDDLVRDSSKVPGTKTYTRVGVRIHDRKSPMPPRGQLDQNSLAVIDTWLAAGAPNGSCSAVDAGQGPNEEGWPAHCDATYKILAHAPESLDTPFTVPSKQEIHPKIIVDAPWGDEEVQAIAFRPITDNKAVLHHWILNGADRTFLTGWAPGGSTSAALPDDVGMYMPNGKGSMYLDMHYYNLESASDALDHSGVEVCVLKKPNFRPNLASVFRNFGSIGGSDLVLAPANGINHPEEGTCQVKVTEPVRLLTAAPHAHTHAVHMRFTVTKADGREIVMHDAPFSFDAQSSYLLPEEVILETGDVVHTVCTYTNMTNRNVRFGESTTDEMCFNFAVYYPMNALSCSRNTF